MVYINQLTMERLVINLKLIKSWFFKNQISWIIKIKKIIYTLINKKYWFLELKYWKIRLNIKDAHNLKHFNLIKEKSKNLAS